MSGCRKVSYSLVALSSFSVTREVTMLPTEPVVAIVEDVLLLPGRDPVFQSCVELVVARRRNPESVFPVERS